jgi:flagellar biosynthesis protein FlhA
VVEQMVVDSVRRTEAGSMVAMEPASQQKLQEAIRVQAERLVAAGHQPLALCAPRARAAFRQIAERGIPTIVVLSYAEVAPGVEVEALGMVEIGG